MLRAGTEDVAFFDLLRDLISFVRLQRPLQSQHWHSDLRLPSIMSNESAQDDDLISDLQELRDRVGTLEKQNQALLTVNQIDATLRSHTPTLEPVKEEENEDESSLHDNPDARHDSDEDAHIGCSTIFHELLGNARDEVRTTVHKAGPVVKKVGNVDLGKLAPKHLIREYKLKRLRREWRAEVGRSVQATQRPATFDAWRPDRRSLKAHQTEPGEAELDELQELSHAVLATAEELSDDIEANETSDEEREKMKILSKWFNTPAQQSSPRVRYY